MKVIFLYLLNVCVSNCCFQILGYDEHVQLVGYVLAAMQYIVVGNILKTMLCVLI